MSKPGYKTTEFWMSAVATIVGLVMASGAIQHDTTLQVMGFVVSALSQLGYTGARVATKRKELATTKPQG